MSQKPTTTQERRPSNIRANPEDILSPSNRVPDSMPDHDPTKTDVAARMLRSEFTGTGDPRIKAALAAITIHYPHLDPLMGDIQILGGDKLYFSAEAWMKEFHAKVPISCRRWVKRHASPAEYESLALEPWARNVRGEEDGYVGHGSRLWWVELWMRPWKNEMIRENDEAVLMQALPAGEWYLISGAWGESNEYNMELSISAAGEKWKGDARILDRMAIKRGQHECNRETFSLTLRGAKNIDQVELMRLGMRVSTSEPTTVDIEPAADDGTGGEPLDPKAAEQAAALREESVKLKEYGLRLGVPPRAIDEAVETCLKLPDPVAGMADWSKKFETTAPVDADSKETGTEKVPVEPSQEATQEAGKPGGRRPRKPKGTPPADATPSEPTTAPTTPGAPEGPPVDPGPFDEPAGSKAPEAATGKSDRPMF